MTVLHWPWYIKTRKTGKELRKAAEDEVDRLRKELAQKRNDLLRETIKEALNDGR